MRIHSTLDNMCQCEVIKQHCSLLSLVCSIISFFFFSTNSVQYIDIYVYIYMCECVRTHSYLYWVCMSSTIIIITIIFFISFSAVSGRILAVWLICHLMNGVHLYPLQRPVWMLHSGQEVNRVTIWPSRGGWVSLCLGFFPSLFL